MPDKYSVNLGLDDDPLDPYGFDDEEGALPFYAPPAPRAPNPLRDTQRKTAQDLLDQGLSALKQNQSLGESAIEQKRAVLQASLDKLLNAPKDNTALLMGLAAGFLKPTRTGSFFESLGQAGESGLPALLNQQQRDDKRRLEALQAQLGLAGTDADLAKLRLDSAGKQAELGRGLLGDITRVESAENLLQARTAGSQELARLRASLAPKTNQTDAQKDAEFLFPDDVDAQRKYVERVRTQTKDKGTLAASPEGKIAIDEGLEPGTDEYKQRVTQLINNRRKDSLTAVETKELFEAEDTVNVSNVAETALTDALALNEDAYEGATAKARAWAMRNLGSQSKGVTATTEFNNIVTGQMLAQLKATFGAAPTEGERKILEEMQAAVNLSVPERDALLKRARTAVQRRREVSMERIANIKGGEYRLGKPATAPVNPGAPGATLEQLRAEKERRERERHRMEEDGR